MVLGAFRKPPDRLKIAIVNATKPRPDRERAIVELRAAITKDIGAVIEAGASDIVLEAFRALVTLMVQSNQYEQAFHTLEELRGISFGSPLAHELGVKLANVGSLPENDLVWLSDWLADNNWLGDAAPALRSAVDERYRRSAPLAGRLGDALTMNGEYEEAIQRFRAAIDLRPEDGLRYIPKLLAATEALPTNQLAQETLGLLYYRQKDYEKSCSHLSSALSFGDLDVSSLFILADANLELNRLDQAGEVLEGLLNKSSNEAELIRRCERLVDRDEERGSSYRQAQRIWGDALRRQSRFEEALGRYRLGLDNSPVDDESGRFFAVSLVDRLTDITIRISPTNTAEAYLELARAHLLTNAPERALEAYVNAVIADEGAIGRAIFGIREIIRTAPDLLSARFQLADLQTESRDLQGAFETLQAIRKELPASHSTTLEPLLKLLHTLEEGGLDETLATSANASTFSNTLMALAEETAITSPIDAVPILGRLLEAFGASQFQSVLEELEKTGLLRTQPLQANLVKGDAYLAANNFEAALEAYRRAPLNSQTIDMICERLELLAEADALHPEALLVSAAVRFENNRSDLGIELLHRAYDRDPDKTASDIIMLLEPLHQARNCPPGGLDLLIDGLTQRGDESGLESALIIIRSLFTEDNNRASIMATKSRRIQQKTDHNSRIFAQAALLAGEGLASLGNYPEAVSAYMEAIGHPQVDENNLLELLEKITQQAPELSAGWIALGDAYSKKKKPDYSLVLEAYRRGLRSAPVETIEPIADGLIERLGSLKFKAKSEDVCQGCILKAEAFARSGRHSLAYKELRDILEEFGKNACGDIHKVTDLLPNIPETWFLRSEVEIASRQPETASNWLESVVKDGSEEDLPRLEQALRQLSNKFPESAEPHLVLAQALKRLERMEEAANELGFVVSTYPSARAHAMIMLDELTQVSSTSVVWLERGRGFIEDDNVPAALEALALAVKDDNAISTAYDHLQTIAARHPEQPEVLKSLVELETRIGDQSAIERAVAHVDTWLETAPDQASQVSNAAENIYPVLEKLHLESASLGMRTHLVWADALFLQNQDAAAARHLSTILDSWPKKSQVVLERCQKSLQKTETLEVRLTQADAHYKRKEYEQAYQACNQYNYEEPSACQSFVDRCQVLLEVTRGEDPNLAARVSFSQAEWLARLHDTQAVSEACAQAASLDPTLIEEVSSWLHDRGWDDNSSRQFHYTNANILREAGEEKFEKSLQIYQALLERDFQNEALQVLEALNRFPSEYVPAWQMKIEVYLKLGKDSYPRAFEAMEQMIRIFGTQHNDLLIAVCDRMDEHIPGVHLMRARIHETAGELDLTASSLLRLQSSLPDQFEQVKQTFLELIEHYPEKYSLRIALGDAYRYTEQWEIAFENYLNVHNASVESIPELVDRYKDILIHLPQGVPVRWGLSKAHWALGEPFPSACYIDEITNLDGTQATQAEEFLDPLVKRYPGCGQGWYVRGKLAYWSGNYPQAIEYFERSLKKGDVYQDSFTLLHEMLGKAYQQEGDLEKALSNLRKSIALSPDNPGLRQALISVRLAILDKAIALKGKEIETSPDSLSTTLELADLYQQRGSYTQAIQLLQPMLDKTKQRGKVYLALARCFAAQGFHHLSAASLESAISSGELSTEERKETLYRLAQARRTQLRFDEALQALEQVCALDVNYQNVLGVMDMIQREKVAAGQQAVGMHLLSGVKFTQEGQ